VAFFAVLRVAIRFIRCWPSNSQLTFFALRLASLHKPLVWQVLAPLVALLCTFMLYARRRNAVGKLQCLYEIFACFSQHINTLKSVSSTTLSRSLSPWHTNCQKVTQRSQEAVSSSNSVYDIVDLLRLDMSRALFARFHQQTALGSESNNHLIDCIQSFECHT
jgi:hypothetical protein